MKKIMDFLVNKRLFVIITMTIALIVSVFLINKVNINYDMTLYLPDSSNTKQGINIMNDEFQDEASSSFNIMFVDLNDTEKSSIYNDLLTINGVSSVSYDNSEKYNKENYTLYQIYVKDVSDSTTAKDVYNDITEKYNDYEVYTSGEISDVFKPVLPNLMIIIVIIVALIILFVMSSSYIEPLLFLITIGVAILLNMGSNYFFDSVSNQTNSVSALLQAVLSIDYAIMLANRYKQERKTSEKVNSMKKALLNSFKSIFSSSFTTIISLLCLIFMTNSIGKDMGLVLAKGVFISLICVFTVLPSLILVFDKIITKTSKKVLNFRFNFLGNFCYKFRKAILIVFLVILASSFYFKGTMNISYLFNTSQKIEDVFGKSNQIIVVYNNADESKVPELIGELSSVENTSITAYANTFGVRLSSTELALQTGTNEGLISQIYNYYFLVNGVTDGKIAVVDIINFVNDYVLNNSAFSAYLTDEVVYTFNAAKSTMDSSIKSLVGLDHSRMIIDTTIESETQEMTDLLSKLEEKMPSLYLVGNSAMAYEMNKTFNEELTLITILIAVSIFLVVLITFKSLSISIILVAIIQTAVFLLMTITAFAGIDMNYLALIIVQSILMGATIDYAILYTSYYKENRDKFDIKQSIIETYNKSSHTILTSSFILIFVTFIVGISAISPSIGEICLTISKGTVCAVLLILFVLPGIISMFDKLVYKNK